MPYPSEHSCRLLDPLGLQVVGSGEREHEGRAYRVIYARPEGGGSVEQAYRYPAESWTEAEARAHCAEHGHIFEPAAGAAGVELRFQASLRGLSPGEPRLATFYIMDTSLNRNNWRVTDGALAAARPSLLGRPLGCIPGYRVDHTHEPLRVGRWVGAEKPDGYALATAEVTDAAAWERLRSGEWGPVSVVIRASRVTCSACGGDVTGGPDGHLSRGEAHEVVEEFTFSGVDFVSEPAYPGAGPVALGGRGSGVGGSLSIEDGAQGPQGSDPKPEGKRERNAMEQSLEQARRELEAARAENARLKAEIHGARVERALEARARAGLVRDRAAEAERLGRLDDQALAVLAEDAEGIAVRRAWAGARGPKATYAASCGSAFEEAVEGARERLFGHRRGG